MENFSTNKRKRGGQTKYKIADYTAFGTFAAQTNRGKQNNINALKAVSLLTAARRKYPEYDFDYLLTPKKRWTLLAELGRFEYLDAKGQINPKRLNVMIATAQKISSSQMKYAQAAALIRKFRVTRPRSFPTPGKAIISAIENFQKCYPETTIQEIVGALKDICGHFERRLPKPPSTKSHSPPQIHPV